MIWRGLGTLVSVWAVLSGSLARADTAACDASEAALKQVLGTRAGPEWELSTKVFDGPLKLALNVETLRQDFPDTDPDDQHAGWFIVGDGDTPVSVKPPSKAMAQAFIEHPRVSATACSNVLEYARRSGVVRQPAKSRPHRKSNGLYDRTFLELTKAIVSPDGTEALVYVSSVSGPLAGGGRLLLFRRENAGEWALAGQLPLWVS